MGKTINVQLERPWKFTGIGFDNSLIEFPPKNIKYFVRRKGSILVSEKEIKNITRIKRSIQKIGGVLPLIKARKVSLMNDQIDLLHCETFLPLNKNINWVVDLEGVWQLFIGKKTRLKELLIKRILKRKNCKRIIAWTEISKKGIERRFPDLHNKIKVIYPAVPAPQVTKRKRGNRITLLYVGRFFYSKGGHHIIKVMDIITKKENNVNALFVGQIPEHIKKEYSKNKKITITGLIPREKLLKEIYPEADIFIYPGYTDSFGFEYIEAMSFGLPIITIKKENTIELIKEKNGFLIDLPSKNFLKNDNRIIKKFIFYALKLIKNKNLLKEIRKNNLNEIRYGRFSIRQRNKKLREVYEEAIK